MKKLNNRGITTIEVLISFILVMVMTISMYSTVTTFNDRRLREQYKAEVFTYKNLLTKQIQDDFIKIGLTHASYNKQVDQIELDKTIGGNKVKAVKSTYTVNCDLRDGTKRTLIVEQQLGYSTYHIGGVVGVSDYFMIKYGKPNELVEYPIPDLGEFKVDDTGKELDTGNNIIKDLSINNVLINIKNDQILSIYIGFYHPTLSTKYGINIVSPINFVSSGTDGSNSFDFY